MKVPDIVPKFIAAGLALCVLSACSQLSSMATAVPSTGTVLKDPPTEQIELVCSRTGEGSLSYVLRSLDDSEYFDVKLHGSLGRQEGVSGTVHVAESGGTIRVDVPFHQANFLGRVLVPSGGYNPRIQSMTGNDHGPSDNEIEAVGEHVARLAIGLQTRHILGPNECSQGAYNWVRYGANEFKVRIGSSVKFAEVPTVPASTPGTVGALIKFNS